MTVTVQDTRINPGYAIEMAYLYLIEEGVTTPLAEDASKQVRRDYRESLVEQRKIIQDRITAITAEYVPAMLAAIPDAPAMDDARYSRTTLCECRTAAGANVPRLGEWSLGTMMSDVALRIAAAIAPDVSAVEAVSAGIVTRTNMAMVELAARAAASCQVLAISNVVQHWHAAVMLAIAEEIGAK